MSPLHTEPPVHGPVSPAQGPVSPPCAELLAHSPMFRYTEHLALVDPSHRCRGRSSERSGTGHRCRASKKLGVMDLCMCDCV